MTGTCDKTMDHETTEGYMTWGEVLRVHQTLRNVCAPTIADAALPRSVLALFGPDTSYPSEWHGEELWLVGEVEAADGGPDPANRGLIVAEVHGYPVRLFERVLPNRWHDRGYYRVRDHHSLVDRAKGKRVVQFLLSPIGEEGAEMETTRIPRITLDTNVPR